MSCCDALYFACRCVQRLRSRIADESLEKRREAQEQWQDQVMRAARNGGVMTTEADAAGDGMNRVPSFYTTRSILNLSGLSVSDPTPECYASQEPDHPGGFKGSIYSSRLASSNSNIPNLSLSSKLVPTNPNNMHQNSNDKINDHFNGSNGRSNLNLDPLTINTDVICSTKLNDTMGMNSVSSNDELDELGLSANVPAPDMYLADQPKATLFSSRYNGLYGSGATPSLIPSSTATGTGATDAVSSSPKHGRHRYYSIPNDGGSAISPRSPGQMMNSSQHDLYANANATTTNSNHSGNGGALNRSRYEALGPPKIRESQIGGIVK